MYLNTHAPRYTTPVQYFSFHSLHITASPDGKCNWKRVLQTVNATESVWLQLFYNWYETRWDNKRLKRKQLWSIYDHTLFLKLPMGRLLQKQWMQQADKCLYQYLSERGKSTDLIFGLKTGFTSTPSSLFSSMKCWQIQKEFWEAGRPDILKQKPNRLDSAMTKHQKGQIRVRMWGKNTCTIKQVLLKHILILPQLCHILKHTRNSLCTPTQYRPSSIYY